MSHLVAKLVNVPVVLTGQKNAQHHQHVTFHVLDSPTYHFILGLPFLQQFDVLIDCTSPILIANAHEEGTAREPVTITLKTRASVQTTPTYTTANSRLLW